MKTLVVGPNAIASKSSANCIDVFNADNCAIVYKADGSYKSWVPGRSLNAFTVLEPDSGYLAIMHQTLDVSDDFISVADTVQVAKQGIYIFNGYPNDAVVHFLNSDGTSLGTQPTTFYSGCFIDISLVPTGTTQLKITKDPQDGNPNHATVTGMYWRGDLFSDIGANVISDMAVGYTFPNGDTCFLNGYSVFFSIN